MVPMTRRDQRQARCQTRDEQSSVAGALSDRGWQACPIGVPRRDVLTFALRYTPCRKARLSIRLLAAIPKTQVLREAEKSTPSILGFRKEMTIHISKIASLGNHS